LSPEFQSPKVLVDLPEAAEAALVDVPELEHADFSDTQSAEPDVLDESELTLDELPDLVLIDERELEPSQTGEAMGANDAANVDLELLSLDLKDLDGLAASSDEQVKVIGDLRISIPLFTIFLNEADEQSRRLSTMLSEWAMNCTARWAMTWWHWRTHWPAIRVLWATRACRGCPDTWSMRS